MSVKLSKEWFAHIKRLQAVDSVLDGLSLDEKVLVALRVTSRIPTPSLDEMSDDKIIEFAVHLDYALTAIKNAANLVRKKFRQKDAP